jgi:hypothetical protein
LVGGRPLKNFRLEPVATNRENPGASGFSRKYLDTV